jgi:asparagine synthase (glutamine-hydrolysing)
VLAGARQLGPGEVWTLSPTRRVRHYFQPRERLQASRSLAKAAEMVGEVVTRAIVDAVPEGARVAAFLSGGLDSSVVLARLHQSGIPVPAYTLHFGDQHPGEIGYARAVAEHVGAEHRVLVVDDRMFADALPAVVLHLEDVVSEAIAVPNFLLAREAAREHDVVFTGEGGDQSFGGPKNIGMVLARAYAGHPASASLGETYLAIHQYLANDLDRALTPECLAGFDPDRLYQDVADRWFDAGPNPRGRTFVGRLMIGNTVIKGGSNILVKVAKMIGFANDVGLRSPFFDPAVVRAAFTVPPWQKQEGTAEKLVLRTIARRWLPPHCVDRPKRGMSLPLEAYLRGALGVLARDTLTEKAVRERGIFRWEYVEPLLSLSPQASDSARSRSPAKLWLVLVTELHHRALDALAKGAREARAKGRPRRASREEVSHA